MVQIFNITANGEDITSKVDGCTVSKAINRFYHIVQFNIGDPNGIALEKDIVVTYGDQVINCFVYSSTKIKKDLYRVVCRTEGAKLTEPYSPNDVRLEEETTSHALSARYASDAGITINHIAGDLDFGGSYERTGTMLSSLTNIANITGAKYYEKAGEYYITPSVGIDADGEIIPDSDVMDFVSTKRSVYNKGVGFITIRNGGSESNDIISRNGIYIEIDECDGSLVVFPNPYAPIEESNGVSPLTATVIERSEEHSITDVDVIPLNGAIASISEVKLNGNIITNYNFEVGHNVLYFTTTQRGTLSVSYNASAYRGYCNVSLTPMGRFISLDLYYLDQLLKFQSFLSIDCDINGLTDGSMTVITDKELDYVTGFSVWIIGGLPVFTFYNRSQQITGGYTQGGGGYISRENPSLDVWDAGGYVASTRYEINTVTQVTSGGDVISHNIVDDDGVDKIHLDIYKPDIEVVYTVTATQYQVQFPLIPDSKGDIRMVIINEETGNPFEFDLTESEGGYDCVLNVIQYVDVVGELSVSMNDAVGKTVSWVHPVFLTTHNATIGADGRVGIYVDADGDYLINTTSVLSRSSITMKINTGL